MRAKLRMSTSLPYSSCAAAGLSAACSARSAGGTAADPRMNIRRFIFPSSLLLDERSDDFQHPSHARRLLEWRRKRIPAGEIRQDRGMTRFDAGDRGGRAQQRLAFY